MTGRKNPRVFWNRMAKRYAKSPVRNEAIYQKKLAITQEYFQPDWSVFEFGCGTGTTAIAHAPHVRHILATDLSDQMLEIASGKAQQAGIDNIRFEQGTLDSLELEPGQFDAVLGLNILHLLEDVDSAVRRVYELLKPGGVFVSSTALIGQVGLHWRLLIPVMQLLGFAPHVARLTKDGLLSRLRDTGFRIEHEWQPDRVTIFIVARKD